MVVFMDASDIAERRIAEHSVVELESLADPATRRILLGFKVQAYDIPRGSIASYCPKTNGLMPISHFDHSRRRHRPSPYRKLSGR